MEGGCVVAVDMLKDSLFVEVLWAGDWSICLAFARSESGYGVGVIIVLSASVIGLD